MGDALGFLMIILSVALLMFFIGASFKNLDDRVIVLEAIHQEGK